MAVMSSEAEPRLATPRHRPGLALLTALLAAVPYALCLALPYYVTSNPAMAASARVTLRAVLGAAAVP